jgi:type IV pilus assembly protein PilW
MEFSMKHFSKRRSDFGFTLIEMLIAIAVSGIVLAGLVSVFMTTNRAYTHQDETATLQQNLRVARINLERDIRMAGCGFGTSFFYLGNPNLGNPNPIPDLVNTEPIPPVVNSNGGGDDNSDILAIRYVNYSDSCSGALPQVKPSTDAGAINFTGASGTITVSHDMTASPFNSWSTALGSGQILAVYTRSSSPFSTTLISDVFTITGITPTVPPVPSKSLVHCSNSRTLSGIPPTNSSINCFNATQLVCVPYRYNSANHTLERNGMAIAENIEDLQFAFGLDTNGNGVVESAEWVNNQTLDDTQRADIRLIRISILGRSTDPINGQALNSPPQIEDHIAGAAQDRYLRQLLQFQVALPNMQ